MNLKGLEAFIWVARLGGLRAAAAQLRISQPAISARINELEASLGARLLERSERPVRPTAKGEELMAYAQRMVALAEEMQQRVGGLQTLSGPVRIGATSTLATRWLPKLLKRLSELYPAIDIEISADLSINISHLMEGGRLDIAFLVGQVPGPAIRNRLLRRIELAWVASADLSLPPTTLSARELAEWPLITDARGSAIHQVTESWLRDGGAAPKRLHFCSGLITRMELAMQGVGVAILPTVFPQGTIAARKLRVVSVDTPLPYVEFVMASASPAASPAIGVVADIAADIIAHDADFRIF